MPAGLSVADLLSRYLEAKRQNPAMTPEQFTQDPEELQQLQSALADLSGSSQGTIEHQEGATPLQTLQSLPAKLEEPMPTKLGIYTIIKKVGEGAMGSVYLGKDPRLNREVAIKVMKPELATSDVARARFLREAQSMAAVSHDNIATIHAADEEADGTTWLAMEFLKGTTLDEYVKKGRPLKYGHIIRFGRDIARGLQAAHSKGLIHRDIKPANIWLEIPNGRVKLLDFGLARQVDEGNEVTGSNTVVGTPSYMAPEQANNDPNLDHRCDLFSLGVVLYRLTTGDLPFKGTSLVATLMALATKEATPVLSLKPDCLAGLAELIHQLLQKQPEDRPKSAKAVAETLFNLEKSLSQSGQQPIVEALPAIVEPSLTALTPWAGIDESATNQPNQTKADSIRTVAVAATELGGPPKRRKLLFTGFGAFALLLFGFIVIKITNKDGSVTELKVPEDAKIEVDGKPIKPNDKNTVVMPPVKPPVPAPSATIDPDRKAAEWVLSVGGHGTVLCQGRNVDIQSPLPKEPFELHHVGLASGEKFTNEDLSVFKDCKNLQGFRIDSEILTDAGLAHFKDSRAIRYIQLASTKVTDAGLAHFKDHKDWFSIILLSPQVTDAGLANFKGCDELHRLALTGSKVTDAGLANFKNCKALSMLNLLRMKVTDAGLAHFKDCKNLSGLTLDGLQLVTDAGLAHFKDCKNLTGLSLEGTPVSDTGLAHFKDCKKLESLDLNSTQVTDTGLAHFKDCKSLTKLYLAGRNVSDTGLALFKDLKNLTALELTNTKVSDAGLAHFNDCKNLTLLYLSDTQVTDVGLAHFKDFKTLEILSIKKTKVTAARVEELRKALPKCRIEWDGGVIEPSAATDPDRTATFKNSLGMEFVKVPKGTGWLGGGAGKQGETKVVIEQDFYLGKYEVTQEEWEAVTGQNPSHFSRNGGGKGAVKDIPDADLKRFPVENVSWDDCQHFIKKLNEKEKDMGWIYRLPKEAEWEYACRGGPVDKALSAFDFYFAKPTNKLLPEQANFAPDPEKGLKGLQRTCKVGMYESNSLGLYDLHGNVREWCEDLATGADGSTHRVRRGGDLLHNSGRCKAAFQFTSSQSFQFNNFGLRLARVPVGPAVAVPATTANPAPVALTESQRKAVEWVVKSGGRLRLHTGDAEITVTDVGQIPSMPFKVLTVNFEGKKLPADWLTQMRELPPIDFSLEFNNTAIGDPEIATMVAMPNLAVCPYWSLSETKITDASAAKLGALKNFAGGQFGKTKLSNDGAKSLAQSPHLMHMTLSETDITDEGLAHLSQAPKWWTNLDISKTKVTETGVKKFRAAWPQCRLKSDFGLMDPAADPNRKAAEWLLNRDAEFGYSDATGFHLVTKGMKHELPKGEVMLNNFNLSKAEFADQDLAKFRGLKQLSSVVLVASEITNVGCEHLATLPTLQKLYLTNTKISDAGLTHLAQAAKLEVLHISGTKITDEGLQQLVRLKSLTELTVVKTGVSEAGVKKLSVALPKCKIESDFGTYGPK
jgi:eukaryotic-like serine/threonine-protein kinase